MFAASEAKKYNKVKLEYLIPCTVSDHKTIGSIYNDVFCYIWK